MTSIATRVFRLTFLVNLVFLMCILFFAWWALEYLEDTMLESDHRIEVENFIHHSPKDKPLQVTTDLFIRTFIPYGADTQQHLPPIFHNIPAPFQGEVVFQDKEYSVVSARLPEGVFYAAKDLQLFESWERKMIFLVSLLALGTGLSCYLIARLFSRRIASPVLRLADAIEQTDDKDAQSRLEENYIDTELNAVASAINRYRGRLDQSIAREKKLVSMASHELRTPVAVILGAARIMEKRNLLGAEDAKTLQRIIMASEEMTANIRTLLALVRQGKSGVPDESFTLEDVLENLLASYSLEHPANAKRLHLERPAQPVVLTANKALVRMLLHNLISNALNHTRHDVHIQTLPARLTICDQGNDLNSLPRFTDVESAAASSAGLGLYIVNLACEQLGWQLDVADKDGGTCISVRWDDAENTR